MTVNRSVKFRGREIESPFWRVVVVVVLFVGLVLSFLFVGLYLLVTLPLALILHVPLWLVGRRGTLREDVKDGVRTLHFGIDREAFRRDDD